MQEAQPQLSADGIYRAPALPPVLKVLAIRVEFAEDTLSTTTGDGSFFRKLPEGVEPQEWLIDPPPHNDQFFADQLYAARLYYERFSRGTLTLTGHHNNGPTDGGDIYPLGEFAAYKLPYPIWHINYGDGDHDRLNRTLIEFFVDAWRLADADPEVDISHYDLFIIFHAGAGNEFDTGFDLTPHDIPSVVIGAEDLGRYADLPIGVPMQNGYIRKGAILPETQRQDNIDVGLLGTVCAQIGFLIGMPHLYDTETGAPGIGLLGLMDRGFGGFFGVAPIPPSAWMRAYMGWDEVTTIREGEIRVGALHLPDQAFVDDPELHRLVRVPINDDEYFLIEARRRDPDGDSVTYAIDRDGDRLILRDDYTMELDPTNVGAFTSPVSIEDHDFDLPASGMLIWHIDESVIRANIASDKLQVNRNRRAVDLEEADGTEDIGEEYEFLQPGDGAEYGVREDAWYVDNELWRLSNNSSFVRFGSGTNPSTASNSGGQTHIEFTDFSAIGDTMTAIVSNAWRIYAFPDTLPYSGSGHLQMLSADLDGDSLRELVLIGSDGALRGYRGDGSLISAFDPWHIFSVMGQFLTVAGKIDLQSSDLREDLVIASHGRLQILRFNPVSGLAQYVLDLSVDTQRFIDLTLLSPIDVDGTATEDPDHLSVIALSHETAVGVRVLHLDFPGGAPRFQLRSISEIDPAFAAAQRAYLVPFAQHDAFKGTPYGHQALIVSETGAVALYDANEPFDDRIVEVPDVAGLHTDETLSRPVSIASPASIAAATSEGRIVRWRFEQGVLQTPDIEDVEYAPAHLVPFDVDGDGFAEISTMSGSLLVGYEEGGIVSETTPIVFPSHLGVPEGAPQIVTRFERNDDPYFVSFARKGEDQGMISAIDLRYHRAIAGFPLEFRYQAGQPAPELLVDRLAPGVHPQLVVLSQPYEGAGAQLRVYTLPGIDTRTAFPAWSGSRGNSAGTGMWWVLPDTPPAAPGANLSNAYAWPNPVYDDLAHIRFRSGGGGVAKLRIYDLAGRKVHDTSHPFVAHVSGEQEIAVNVSNWPSGVYVARLETGGQHALIRFAVVQ